MQLGKWPEMELTHSAMTWLFKRDQPEPSRMHGLPEYSLQMNKQTHCKKKKEGGSGYSTLLIGAGGTAWISCARH